MLSNRYEVRGTTVNTYKLNWAIWKAYDENVTIKWTIDVHGCDAGTGLLEIERTKEITIKSVLRKIMDWNNTKIALRGIK